MKLKVVEKSGSTTILVDVETGELYYCRELEPVTLQQAAGYITNPKFPTSR